MISPSSDQAGADKAGDASGRIAIVGMAGRFPDAATTGDVWRLLRAGREATHWFSDEELLAAGVSAASLRDPRYVKAGMVLPDMEAFDAGFFGLSPREAAILDPQHRHFLECTWEALEDSGHRPEAFPGAIGVFAGCGMQAYFANNLLTNAELVDQVGLFLLRHTGNDKDFLATRASYLLNLQGPSISVQTACSTSLVAVHFAVQSLLSGECDMALAGGVTIEVPHRHGYRAAEGEILSPDGHCRAFDDDANGTLFGSGVGVVTLRRLEDAVAARDHIYAVICSSAVNNDGSTKAGYLAPSVEGQVRAAAEALALGGIDPGSVSYIEAHGTGTLVGDPIELTALSEAYAVPGRRQFCGIGSLKTNIGHLDTAAGVAGLIKVALALRHQELPASLNCTRPNSRFDFAASPFSVVTAPTPWTRTGTPRRAAVNSLGVGGTNAHVILEEAPPLPATGPARDWQILTLSARTADALDGSKRKWREALAEPAPDLTLANAAFTTQTGRRAFPHRCAVIARDHAGACEVLASRTHRRMTQASVGSGTVGAVFMFPGGGAQYPGMGRDLYRTVPAFREAVDTCLGLLPPDAPDGLRALLLDSEPGDAAAASRLARPGYTIPALFIVEYATARMMLAWNIRPAALIGHSMGEYAAACIAGVMSLADALSVVVLRGQIFEAAPAGAMLAVSLPSAELRERIGDALDIAAENAAALTVATGSVHEIAGLERRLAADGIECRRLRIDVAAHSRMLDPFLDRFRARLQTIALHEPTLPFVSNLSGAYARPGELTQPDYWVSHLRQTVRFAAGLSAILAEPDRALLEIGPGHSLGALARLADGKGSAPLANVPTLGQAGDTESDVAVALAAIGKLWACGYEVDWAAVRGGDEARLVPAPTYAFEKQRHWIAAGRAAAAAGPSVGVEAGSDAVQRLDAMEDWFSVPQWVPAPPLPAPATAARSWLVFADASRVSTAILAALESRGARVAVVRPGETFSVRNRLFHLRPDQPSQYRDLITALDREGMAPDRILHLWSTGAPTPTPDAPCAGQALGFDSLLALCQALQYCDVAMPLRLTAVTRESQSVAGGAARHPERATLLGLCRVVPREMPGLTARLVDLGGQAEPGAGDDPVAEAARILAESDADQGPDLVAHRGASRMIQRMVPARIESPEGLPGRLRRNGVYLVTGGFGGLGLTLAGWLVREVGARLVLVGRDASAQAAAIRRLEAEGAEILAVGADVTDRAAMERTLGAARERFGTIHGVFHAAGSIDDGPIPEKTLDSTRRVIAPKLAGGLILDALLPEGSLDLFVVFSSTSAQIGPPGQVDYAAANTFLDALAARRSDGLAVAWGIWGDIGMAARIHGGAEASGPAAGHPLLGTETGRTATTITFQALYDPARMWMLAEHVLDGRPILPGAAYAEIALAAAAAGFDSKGVDLAGLTIDLPLVFEPGVKRLVRTTLTARDAGGFALSVESRALMGEDWVEHARATLRPGSALPWAVRRVARRAARREGAHALPGLGFPQGETVTFGPRWHTIRWIERGDWEAVAELELAAEFAADLDGITAHPALTDIATTFGLHLLAAPADDRVYVPTSVERMRIAPERWPRRIRSHVRLTALQHGASARFDVVIGDTHGVPLAVFEGFTLQGVSRTAKTSAEAAPPSLQARLNAGIRAEDAPDLFRRVLDCRSPGIVASSIALSDLRREVLAGIRPKPAAAARSAPGDLDYASEIERQIAGYWADLLGIPAVHPHDDFFELGGFSLLAVRLFARIRKHHDVDLPIATLFRAPTLRQLAVLVSGLTHPASATDRAAGADEAGKVLAMPPVAWSPLVEICRGVPTRAPLFCIHGGQGNVLNFEKLSRRLGRDQPFYGLQARGVDGRLAPLETIEEMAASYIEAIREVDAHGPYRIAGYSGGGVIAYEVAQQLTRAGCSVALLVLFDTLSATSIAQRHSTVERLWAVRRWSLGYKLGWPSRLIERRRRAAEFAREVFDPAAPIPDAYRAHVIMNAYLAAQSRYQPVPYDGSLLLFRSTDAYVPYLLAGPDLGWGDLVRGGIDIHSITATHETLFQEPAVDKLAGILRGRLDALMHYPVRRSA